MSYDLRGYIWHQHSPKLMEAILELWPEKDIAVRDLGCGLNYYIHCLHHAGYTDVRGVDAMDSLSRFALKKDILSEGKSLYKNARYISLEVGEHIAPEHMGRYLDVMAQGKREVLMSWAIPGQAGHGHVNCQPNEVIIAEMEKRGKRFNPEITQRLRDAVQGCHCSWFKDTLMYFE